MSIYQIIQKEIDKFTLLIAPLLKFSSDEAENIKKELNRVLGYKVKTEILFTENNFVVKNGKQLPFVSLINS